MAAEVSKAEEHTRYEVEEVVIICTDPHTKEKISVRFIGSGAALVEPVMRKTDAHPKTPLFDGNQVSLVLAFTEKKVDKV